VNTLTELNSFAKHKPCPHWRLLD